jgi:hypothetical protein
MSKANVRAEIEAMTNEFLEAGGRISRERADKVTIVCPACKSRRFVHLTYAMRFGRVCPCGARTRIEP